MRGDRSTQRLAECVRKITEPVASLRYESATRTRSIGEKPARAPPGKRDIAMNIRNERLDSAARQPRPPIADNHARNFSAARDSASSGADRQTGLAGGGTRDFGSKALQAGDLKGGATLDVVGRDDATKAKIDRAVDKAKGDLDSMSEMGEMESLRLQMAMDRRSKMLSTLSNLVEKMSDTSERITANLK